MILLNKELVHLKNIIFFKLILYLATILCAMWIISNQKYNLNQTDRKIAKIQAILKEISQKFSQVNLLSKEELEVLLMHYDNAKNIEKNFLVDLKNNFPDLLASIQKKYQLPGSIKFNLSPLKINNQFNKFKTDKLDTMDISIKLMANDLNTMINVIQEIYELLPKYSIIQQVKINYEDLIVPDVINNINKKEFGNITSKVKMQIRFIKIT